MHVDTVALVRAGCVWCLGVIGLLLSIAGSGSVALAEIFHFVVVVLFVTFHGLYFLGVCAGRDRI